MQIDEKVAASQVRRRRDGTYAEGNQGHVVHGGEAAVKAIKDGRVFSGLAAQAEQEVIRDLEASGLAALVREAAVRLHTAMRLYWGAVMSAADSGDLEKLDSYCARFGWLASSALRAWREVKAEDSEPGAYVLDALKAAEEATSAHGDG